VRWIGGGRSWSAPRLSHAVARGRGYRMIRRRPAAIERRRGDRRVRRHAGSKLAHAALVVRAGHAFDGKHGFNLDRLLRKSPSRERRLGGKRAAICGTRRRDACRRGKVPPNSRASMRPIPTRPSRSRELRRAAPAKHGANADRQADRLHRNDRRSSEAQNEIVRALSRMARAFESLRATTRREFVCRTGTDLGYPLRRLPEM